MKRVIARILLLAAVATMSAALSSCWSDRYITLDDDEWSGADFNGENLLLNGELEIDDYER